MPRTLTLAFALLLLVQLAGLHAAEPQLPIASYLDDQVLAVVRLDVSRVDVAATVKRLETLLPPDLPEARQQLTGAADLVQKLINDFQKSGGQDVYVLASMADIPQRPPLVIATVKPGGDTRAVAGLLSGGNAAGSTAQPRRAAVGAAWPGNMFEVCKPVGHVVLCGGADQVQRVQAMTAQPRPDLMQALTEGGPAAIRVALALTPDSRRVIREMLAPLPAEFGGLTGQQLVDGLQWAALSLELPPQLAVRFVVQSRDADAAQTLGRAIEAATKQLRQQAEVRAILPKIDDLVRGLLFKCEGNRLTLSLDQAQVQPLLALLDSALNDAREAARRTASMNNLKQIALAMHVYHNTHGCFPPQASDGPDGKKLLSWRVHLLPFLDQEALYRQFHLNEPWDSAHNRALIAKQPRVYVPPHLAAKDLTTYLVPVGDKTVFAGREGTPLSQITDGTSHTILVVEAAPSAAVIWTKPDDLVVDMHTPLKGLAGLPAKGFLAAFCDGCVRFVSDSVEPETLRRLLQMNDGQPVTVP